MRTVRNQRLVTRYPWLKELGVEDLVIHILRIDRDMLVSVDEYSEDDEFYAVAEGRLKFLSGRQPVLDALVREGLGDVDAIVRRLRGPDRWEGITIYLPKVSVSEVIAEVVRAEDARIDGELAQIQS